MNFYVVTIFPKMFDSYLQESILARAIQHKKIKISFFNPRDFIKAPKNNYRPVDERPYGGGPGMVMKAEPILKAVSKILTIIHRKKDAKILIVNFMPKASKFTNLEARKIYHKYTDVVLISGRYEGIDARVDKILKTKRFSIGDYVLTGGELPAMILIDSISRQIPEVLGKYESLEEERVSSGEVYTRPEVLKVNGKNYKVPKILLSGNHKKIADWKKSR